MSPSTGALAASAEKLKSSQWEKAPASWREGRRQTIIHKVITNEQQYIRDLDLLESIFIQPLRNARPPIIRPSELHEFVDEVFGNILDLRKRAKWILEALSVRQREQGEVISRVGDVFLEAATEFLLSYPTYIGNLPMGETAMKDKMENNTKFNIFLEQCLRHADNADKQDLKHFLNLPSEHLQKYPALLEAIQKETADGNPDKNLMSKAIEAMKNVQVITQLRTFQIAMVKGPTANFEWHDLVPEEVRLAIPKQEVRRQEIIFELIKGEMTYVKALENIEYIYVRPLRAQDPPIIPRDRLDSFIHNVFHNFLDLHARHRRLVEHFHEIQIQEYPLIQSVTVAMHDALLNLRDSYLKYIANYPRAASRIDDEVANNPAFQVFFNQCIHHPDAHRLDMKSYINRPIPYLLRYELLLKSILEVTPDGHQDVNTIPAVLSVINTPRRESEHAITSAKQKLELWWYNLNVVFKVGEAISIDLLHEDRVLVHTGKLLHQSDTASGGWTEVFVFLFDNYMVLTQPKEKDGVIKHRVYRRPIPLELLSLVTFADPPTQKGSGLIPFHGKGGVGTAAAPLGTSGSPETFNDARALYPFGFHHIGRLGDPYTLFAETSQARLEWKAKLEEAVGLRKAVQEGNKAFDTETLSIDTFPTSLLMSDKTTPSRENGDTFTGEVTCSVPFNTPDGRGLIAIGCAEGVWLGLRHDSRSMRRVLHLKMVTQCAMLEDFGIFLVLADKTIFAYHIESLVPSSPSSVNAARTPQKLSGTDNVDFFSVGTLHGRTLVIYKRKKGLDSIFRVFEPVIDNINEKTKTSGSRFGLTSQRSDWFRVYRDFFLPSESYDLLFLKTRIVILCTKGFEIMDLSDFESMSIPQREDPRLEKLTKRCDSCQPIGMFRSNEDKFLLCYDEFGLYVNRHGYPSRETGTVEWEDTAERVAWHPPYILLFNSRFIEIRHSETGRLVQVILGKNMRCIWGGRGASAANLPSGEGNWNEGFPQESRVHGVIDAESTQPGAVMQHVFELIPTIPLYLPGPPLSPSHAPYFNDTNSPPLSPRLNPPSYSSCTGSLQ